MVLVTTNIRIATAVAAGENVLFIDTSKNLRLGR